jgi:hypothetical protein
MAIAIARSVGSGVGSRFTRSRTARWVSAFLIGLVISLWSANGGIKALFDALNVVYEFVLRVFRGISDDRILANSAAVTFYACWHIPRDCGAGVDLWPAHVFGYPAVDIPAVRSHSFLPG